MKMKLFFSIALSGVLCLSTLGIKAQTEWNFDTTTEGWGPAHSLTTSVSSGILNITITGDDPYILSPGNLHIDASAIKTLRIKVKNSTNQPAYQIYWITDQDQVWGAVSGKMVNVEVTPNLSIQAEYVFDFSTVLAWRGIITRIRLDMGNAPSGSTLAVDYIKLSK